MNLWRRVRTCAVTIDDVIIVPPDVDGLTDEEDIGNEEKTDDVTIQDVPGSLELHIETDHQNEQHSET